MAGTKAGVEEDEEEAQGHGRFASAVSRKERMAGYGVSQAKAIDQESTV
jgi:hypothetical protein